MVKEETWSIPIRRVRAFFREQAAVVEESPDCFAFGSCRIKLTELEPTGTGIWAANRIRIHMEGDDADVKTIYHRYFIQFLSTGG